MISTISNAILNSPIFYREVNTHKLADSLFHSFGNNAEHIVVTITMVANSTNPVNADVRLEQLDLKYKTNAEHAMLYDQNGFGLLYIACHNGHVEVVKLLLTHKDTDINKANENASWLLQYTPLLIACYSSSTQDNKVLFRVLLENKANIDHQNNQGEKALDIAFLKKIMPQLKSSSSI